MNGYNPIIPNELKKYFKDKIIDNSYINKLCILLSSNDKNYDEKRPILNKLTSAIDSNNRKYLTKLKFRFYSENNDSITEEKNESNRKNKLNYDINYFRDPKVIINNEKLMLNFFKRKKYLNVKLPYLSRSTNDLINYNYKKEKDKSNILQNWEKSNNNYLNIAPKIKKIRLKRIHFRKKFNSFNIKEDLIIKPDLSINEENKKINQRIFPNITNKNIDYKELQYLDSSKSSININNYNFSLDQNKLEENRIIEEFNKIKKLSNEKVIKKMENSIEIPGADLQKGIFPKIFQKKTENQIEFLFGNHYPITK